MSDGRTRKTGQHDAQLTRALADAAEAKKAVQELAKRVEKLEAEISVLRGRLSATSAGHRGPPPLPPEPPAAGPKRRNTEKFIDVSAIAELVESMPPPRKR